MYGFVSTKAYWALQKYFTTVVGVGGSAEADAVYSHGRLTGIFGLPIKPDTRLSNEDTDDLPLAVFGLPNATAYAQQIRNIEPYRMEKRFSDAIKGLYVYGVKKVRDDTIFQITQKA